jgi:membrane-associated phospholipid phosphatase
VLSEGGHYLIDLIFGVFVAVAAIVVVPIVMPRLPESC